MIRFLLLFFFSLSAMAGTSIDLQKVTLGAFCRVVYADILKRSFVLDASVVGDGELISVTLLNRSDADLEREAKRVLDMRGYRVEDSAVVFISPKEKKQADNSGFESLVYRPKYRAVTYLLSIAQGLIKQGEFVGRRSNAGIGFNQLSGGANPGFSNSQTVNTQGSMEQGVNQLANVEQDLIIYNGPVTEIKKLQKLLDVVDLPVGELLVKAMVLEVQTTNREGSAVDFVTGVLKSGLGLTVAAGAADSSGFVTAKTSFKGVDFTAIYSALSVDNRFRILTSPRVRVKSETTAKFTVGNETPILASVSYDANGKAIQNVQYKSSGVIFEIKPKIRETVTDMHVTQQISSFVATTNGVNTSPTLTKRELSTDVQVADGDIIILGGLDDEKTTSNNSGLSFFPNFLRALSDEKIKTEIVLMLNVERI